MLTEQGSNEPLSFCAVRITVNDLPPAISYNPFNAVLTVGTLMSPLVPSNGGGAALSYTITPGLPPGIQISPSTVR